MLFKEKTLTRLPGDHKRGIDPGTRVGTYFKGTKNNMSFDTLGALHKSR